MNFIIENWYLIFLAVASGAMLLVSIFRGATGGALSAAAAVHLINREKAVVIDVCEPDEKLPSLVKNKQLPVILVCAKGPRAMRAEAVAKKLGYEKAQALGGGMKAWREAGLPVEKSKV